MFLIFGESNTYLLYNLIAISYLTTIVIFTTFDIKYVNHLAGPIISVNQYSLQSNLLNNTVKDKVLKIKNDVTYKGP